MHTPSRTELSLTSSSAGCGCCSTDKGIAAGAEAVGVEYPLEGLTCGGCLASVEKAVAAVKGVDTATVELAPAGVSRLVVSGPADPSAVRDAVTSAGYSLTS